MVDIGAQIEDFAQLLMDSNPQYIFWKDVEGVYIGCNRLYAHFCNLGSTSQIVGTSDYDYMAKDEADICIAADNEVVQSGKSILNFEEFVTDAHGVSRWYNINKVALKNKAGKVVGVLGAMTDITEIKEKNQIIEQQAEELKNKVEYLEKLNTKLEMVNIDLEQFTYSTSHDLQGPLRVIGNFAGLIKRRYAEVLDKDGNEYLQYITNGTQKMSSFITQILSYSKIDKIEETFLDTDLNLLVEDVLGGLDIPKDKEIKYEIDLPKELVNCQPERMKMLFYNLIDNGIKFNNSEVPTIKINHENRESEWCFSISDNGIGIEEEYANTIFKPFKRLNSIEKFSGNGLGLSICKRIVFLHNGSIQFTKNKDIGSSFQFTISKINKVSHELQDVHYPEKVDK